jgi:hypothetical protein
MASWTGASWQHRATGPIEMLDDGSVERRDSNRRWQAAVSLDGMRALAVIAFVVLSTTVPASAHSSRNRSVPKPTMVPEDVRTALAELSVGVAGLPNTNVPSLPVGYKAAFRVAKNKAGWMVRPYRSNWRRVDRLTIHLVRIVHPLFGEPDHHAFVSISPLRIGDLAWLVVMRDATIPILGPRGGTYIASVAVFVRTDEPSFVAAVSL